VTEAARVSVRITPSLHYSLGWSGQKMRRSSNLPFKLRRTLLFERSLDRPHDQPFRGWIVPLFEASGLDLPFPANPGFRAAGPQRLSVTAVNTPQNHGRLNRVFPPRKRNPKKKPQIPNPKPQRSSKSQTPSTNEAPNPKLQSAVGPALGPGGWFPLVVGSLELHWLLEVGAWSFSGVWGLGFGISIWMLALGI
jgi:hypothetical protein